MTRHLILFAFTCLILHAQGYLQVTTTALPAQTAGVPYSVNLTASGGVPPYSGWTVYGGALPPGLSLDPATGILSGAPGAGIYQFWVTVNDSAGNVSAPTGIVLDIAPAPSITGGTLSNAVVGNAYSAPLSATGGTPPYSNWMVAGGNLPPGIGLDPIAGVLFGNPTNNGFFTFGVTVQDSDGVKSGVQTFSIAVGLSIGNKAPNWTVNAPYSVQLNGVGGTPPYGNWIVASAQLPPGLTLNSSTGVISGTPTSTGGYSFAITFSDSGGLNSTPQPFTIIINTPPNIATVSLPDGIVSVPYSAPLAMSGGTQPASWAITGGTLPAGLKLFAFTGVISGVPTSSTASPVNLTVQATDAAGVVATQPVTLTINQASFLVSPGSLTYTVQPSIPASFGAQTLSVFSNTGSVPFSATASTSSGGSWLSVSGSGDTPGNLSVSVTPGSLAANTVYKGVISITGPTLPQAVTIPVTMTIASSLPGQLSVSPTSLTLNYAAGYAVEERYFLVTNSGSGAINYSATVTTDSCGSWMNLLSGSGAATATNPGYVVVQVSPAGLGNQTCTGKIAVATGSQTQTIPVTMTVSGTAQSILLSRTAAVFQYPLSGNVPQPQTFSVLNAGSGEIDWTLTPQTLSGGNWLTVAPATGTTPAGGVPTPVAVSINPQGLAPGVYYGSVAVTAAGAGNSPQSLTVILNVAGQTPVEMSPTGVILVAQPASTVSETEILTLSNPGTNPVSYTSTVVADNHGTWLIQNPASGTIPAGGQAAMTLQANLRGLSPGVQHAVLRAAFADGAIHTVNVYLIAQGVSSTPGCLGDSYIAVFQSPEQGFQAVAQSPVPLQLIAKDCNTGNLVKRSSGASAQVLIGPDNATAIPLNDNGTGTWTGTWAPGAATTQTSLTAMIDNFASSTGSVIAGQTTLSGSVTAAATGAAGIVTKIVNGVSSVFPGLVTPGSAITIHGMGLGGTQVLLQGQPLTVSSMDDTEVDAIIPSQVTANERQQLLVVGNSTLSSGVDVQVSSTTAK